MRDSLLSECLAVTYNAIHYAWEHKISNRKGVKVFYQSLKDAKMPSCYKVAAITRACALIQSRDKARKRGIAVRHLKPLRPMTCIISGFILTMKGRLFIPLLKRGEYFDIQLNQNVVKTLEGKKVRSLTITPDSLSLCYSEEIEAAPVKKVYGVDRNEKNITFGDRGCVTQIDVKNLVRIKQITREIMGSFRRNDVRIRMKLARKYWKRANDRRDQILHAATNFIIDAALRNHAALALEDLTNINEMYRRGNGQGADYRFRLNSWPHWRAKRMLEYKATWKGLTTVQLTKSETYGSSSECSACGERLHSPAKDGVAHERMLWCQMCKAWIDRDVNAALNLSTRGLARFASSRLPSKSRSQQADFATEEEGDASEAMKGNPAKTVILRVDASKLGHGKSPELQQATRKSPGRNRT